MYRRIDGKAREVLERIELLPVGRVHRAAAAREDCERGDACAERGLHWRERLHGMLAALRGMRARERRG